MTMFENPSVWRYLGMLVLILGMLVGGTWITVKTTTDHLLYQNATRAAQNWAQYLAANVSDLEQIAAGETPSSASLAFFKATRKSGEVFRYTIFNRYGYSILLSDRDKITIVDLSEYSAIAARSIKDGPSYRRCEIRPHARPAGVFRRSLCPGAGRRPSGRHRRGLRGPDGGARQFLPDLSGRGGIALPADRALLRAAGDRVVPANEGKATSRPPYPLSRPSRCADRPRQPRAPDRTARQRARRAAVDRRPYRACISSTSITSRR